MNDKLDRTEAHRYLDLVGAPGYLCGNLGIGPYWNPDGRYDHREFAPWHFDLPGERERMLDEIERAMLADTCDVYVCPAPRFTGARNGARGPKGSNALPPSLLWFDLDGPPADPALLTNLAPVLVASGRRGHLHGYVPLDRPVDLGTHARLNKALADRLGADAKWSDEALLRLPGTWNHKIDPPSPVVFL